MFQPESRRTLAAVAFAALTLMPLSGLQAAPLGKPRPQPGEARGAERLEQREISVWRVVLSLWEKLGAHIDDNGLKVGAHIDDNGLKVGAHIDDNG